ncbi:MAG TPA: class I SAM-dependent methyltransferase [Roseiarcus sp.]|nr:class I SAM-dependent methyltransferase [Roseiarcus sp.]
MRTESGELRERTDLGELGDVAALMALVPVAGLALVDVGCGAGDNARRLAEAGATVLAVEPDPIQAAKNREAAPVAGVTFVEAGAERLPAEPRSMDGVLFFRSLHHVAIEAMDAALAEGARVLKPEGFLNVIEPGMAGAHFPMIRLFHDETRVREAAQDALDRTAARLFRERRSFRYLQRPRYASFDALVARALGQTFNAIRREQVESDAVRALFEAGRTERGDYAFEQPMLIDLFLGPVAA